MPSYLVETYIARDRAPELAARERRARSAAEELTHGKTRVSFDRSIHVPEDEIRFTIRVVEAVSSGKAQVGLPVSHFLDNDNPAEEHAQARG
jgi:hypothetical protein